MTLGQWIFHYMEISKHNDKLEARLVLEKLGDIDMSIQASYLLMGKDSKQGKELITSMADIRKKNADGKSKKPQEKPNDTSDDNAEDILTDEDKELLSFMREQPLKMKETREMKNSDKFILPKANKEEILGVGARVVDSIGKSEKPKLGIF